jgi:hypothetical protein
VGKGACDGAGTGSIVGVDTGASDGAGTGSIVGVGIGKDVGLGIGLVVGDGVNQDKRPVTTAANFWESAYDSPFVTTTTSIVSPTVNEAASIVTFSTLLRVSYSPL